jgi:hypothetical protein
MTTHASHLQAILDAATTAAKANPTSANIAAVEKAHKAMDDHAQTMAADASGEKFKTQAAALEYLQRRFKIEKSKLSKDVQEGRCPRKEGNFLTRDLDFYAAAVHLEPKTSEQKPADDQDIRLKSAQAEERELRVAKMKSELIDAAEEEARDAKLWYAVRSDIENEGPRVINELINRISTLGIPEEYYNRIAALIPELRNTYEDSLAEIFDRYAQAGGVEI